MHQATDEPRLDDTWVQYYGGEKQGGIKRLSSIDDEDSIDDISLRSSLPFSQTAATPVSDNLPETEKTAISSSAPRIHKFNEATPPNRPTRRLSRVEDFRRSELRPADDALPSSVSDDAQAQAPTLISQGDDSKGVTVSNLTAETSHAPAESDESTPSFEIWSQRWAPWLKRGGSIKVCEAFFLLTHAQGSAECFTSNSEIMRLTELSRAQCIRNIHYLIEIGFLDELDEINNKDAKGTYYRFNLIPNSLGAP
jgi:hypothetical protein